MRNNTSASAGFATPINELQSFAAVEYSLLISIQLCLPVIRSHHCPRIDISAPFLVRKRHCVHMPY
jgi:hypothetical protein